MERHFGFVSTRIAGNDGVSLETGKWAAVLYKMGHRCFYFSGLNDRPGTVAFTCEEAFFQHREIEEINAGLFGVEQSIREIHDRVGVMKNKILDDLSEFVKKFSIDILVVENALAIPMNIPLGLALCEFIAQGNVPVIAHHHDFYWERDRYAVHSAVDYLETAFPPDLPTVEHVVINTLSARSLKLRRGIESMVIPNVLDFSAPPPAIGTSLIGRVRDAAGLAPGDPMILQPTRIIPRKCIERSIELVAHLEMQEPVLVISHPSGDEGDEYRDVIIRFAGERGVRLAFLDPGAGGIAAEFSLEAIYGAADLVTYPSSCEGFGNALLEAVYYGKPVLVNRYPVFIADIEQRGFKLILMNDAISSDIVLGVKGVLADRLGREEKARINYSIAAKYYSFDVLENSLRALLERPGLRGVSA
ncbi:MAG: glycosyl transferase family 1 [Spirochaetae bacterium HGW-Spirochaetae-1]|jgi:glycosyltransferase involved in cell wall biosynthesis|nr:MAG: glycosyl transferase family 1 [Spirochaetae bacterium HGW-Spirochaetae-1]